MASFNVPFDWNQSSLSSLDENDFMMLLQKQFPMIGAPVQPTDISKSKVDTGGNATPATAQPPNTTSPLSSDSSPSPPSAQDDTGSLHSPEGNNNQANGSGSRTTRTEDDTHKRKVSADDFEDELEGQPLKSPHLDNTRKLQSRRKSGERPQDESRLLKRKEQNRAAQRAFRERKEKHVKDLEDRVAQLEAQTESQAAENDNLRDMLSRLQNENAVLKQTTFTFSVPNGTGNQRPPQPSTSSLTSPGLFSNAAEAGPSRVRTDSGTPSSHDSPNSIFGRYENYSNVNSSVPAASPSRSSTTSANTNGAITTPDLDAMTYFGSTGPFQTLASNPMFTSYYDPIQSMNAFASFGGWDKWDTDATMTNATATSSPPDNNQALGGLFGDQFSNLIPLSQDFLNPDVSAKANTPGPLGGGGGASPVAHHNSSSNSIGVGRNSDECPKTKADVERMIAEGPKGTFGAPVTLNVKGNNGTPSLSENSMQVEPNEYDVAFQNALGKAAKVHTDCHNTYNIDELCLEMQRKAKCSLGDC